MGLRTDTRKRMIAAAHDLIRRQGLERTGFTQVLKASGAARGAIYHHFPGGKEELAVEVVRRSNDEITARVKAASTTTLPSTALHRYVEETIANLEASGYEDGCPLAPMVLEAADWSDPIREATREAFDAWSSLLTDLLRERGASLDRATRLAMTVIAAIEGGIILARTYASPAPLRAVVKELGPLLDDAVQA